MNTIKITGRQGATSEFGLEVSTKSLKQITDAVRGLEYCAEKGVSVSSMIQGDSMIQGKFIISVIFCKKGMLSAKSIAF